MISKNLIKFNETIQKAHIITISSHVSPDGDAVGSSTALYLLLSRMGKEVYLIENDDYPSNLTFMDMNVSYTKGPGFESDLFIVTDVASIDRIGSARSFFDKASKSLCIDHHKTNNGFCTDNIIEPHYSSTCELVAELMLNGGYSIDPDIASYLYLGIVTDTNRFQYESTSPQTLKIASSLIELKANRKKIHYHLYESLDVDYLMLQAKVIKEAISIKEGKFMVAKLSQKDLKQFNLDYDQTDSLVSIIKSIEGVELVCLVKEEDKEKQKLSFRSKTSIDVAKLAQDFGGGGHIRAAGASVEGSLDDVFKEIISYIEGIE